jgi:predicted MFS family arabinose efflux permease
VLSPAAVLAVVLFAIGVDNYIVVAILPEIAADLGEPIESVGLLASAYAIPLALLAIPFGPISDRLGRRFSILTGMGLFAVAVVASGLAPSYPLLLGARVVNGLGAAMVGPAVFAYAADLSSPEQRGQAMATVVAAFPVSTILGLPLGGFIAASFGWRAVFAFIAIIALVAVTLVWRLPADPPRAATATYREGLRALAGSRATLSAVAVTLAWFTGSFGMFVYLGQYFTESFGFTPVQVGLTLTIVGIVGLLATRVSARLIGRYGAKRVVMGGLACFVAAAVMLPLSRVFLPWALLTMALWVFGVWNGIPAQQTIVSETLPGWRGTALAANTSALYLGGTIGPAITGTILAAGGFPLAGAWSAAVGVVALALAAFLLPAESGLARAAEPAPASVGDG